MCTSFFAPAAFLLLLTVLCLVPATSAFPGAVISITPARISLRVLPGSQTSMEVTVSNQGDEAVGLLPLVMEVHSDGERVLLRESEGCSWFEPEGNRFSLAAAETRSIGFGIDIPASADPGIRRFALAFVESPGEDRGVSISAGIAALVEMEVLPGEAEAAPPGAHRYTVWIAVASVLAAALAALLLYRRRARGGPPGLGREAGKEAVP